MCVLRICGPDFDPEAYLAGGSHLEPIEVYVPGNWIYERRLAKKQTADQGFNVSVSNRDWSDWEGQVEDATVFLREHRAELRALRDDDTGIDVHIDFPTEADPEDRYVTIWEGGFPAAFLKAAADARIDVHTTLYFATPEAEDDAP